MKTRIKTNKTMKLMAKIKELLAGRDKLAKYDELKEWKEKFSREYKCKELALSSTLWSEATYENPHAPRIYYKIPEHIKQIIVSALDAEIAKIDEE